MDKKIKPMHPKVPLEKHTKIDRQNHPKAPPVDPEDPLVPGEDPDFIPEDDLFDAPPGESPTPGEGP